jgi:hypothetical protein
MSNERADSREFSGSIIGGGELMERLLHVRRRKLAYGGLVADQVRGHFPSKRRLRLWRR